MLRKRKSYGFAQPKDLEDLTGLLEKNQLLSGDVMAKVIVDGESAIIFSNEKLLQHVEKQSELYMDGTFKVISNLMIYNLINCYYLL